MTKLAIEKILEQVKYKDWQFHIEEKHAYETSWDHLGKTHTPITIMYMQVRFPDADLVTGIIETQHGRKWILSKHMTKSEVVATAFKAVMTAEEHEMREKFRYRGRMVYGPHFHVDALWQCAQQIEIREDPKSVAVD